MSITPFSTLTLKASPDGDVQEFTDYDSIHATSMRVTNTSTIEALLSIGTIVDYPVPPDEHLILSKLEGVSQVKARTESGVATIRCTAIRDANSEDDIMRTLTVVTVLRDALSNQELIDAAVKKISGANKISAANKAESDEALKTIAKAKADMEELAGEKTKHANNVAAHTIFVKKKETELENQQHEMNNQQKLLQQKYEEKFSEADELNKSAEKRHLSADKREKELDVRLKKIIEQENESIADRAVNESDRQANEKEKLRLAKDKEKLDARRKKLDEANKED